MKSSDTNDWGSRLQPSEKQILIRTAQHIAMLVQNQKKMRRFRARLSEFAEKWKAYRTAHEAEQEGKWQPASGDNPLRTIWPGGSQPRHFPDGPKDIPTILGDYTILGVIHDQVFHGEPINDGCLPAELAEEIWLNLATGRCEESRGIDTSPSAQPQPRYTIPEARLLQSLKRVKADLRESEQKPKRQKQAGEPRLDQKKGDAADTEPQPVESHTGTQAGNNIVPEAGPVAPTEANNISVPQPVQQIQPKPGDDDRTLPPLLPEYAALRVPDADPKTRRELELVLMAHSTMVYGLDNDLTSRRKNNLVAAFDYECESIVLKIAEARLREVQGIPEHDRIERLKRYREFCLVLMREVERSLDTRSIHMKGISELHREHMDLLAESHFFTQLDDDYWKSADEKAMSSLSPSARKVTEALRHIDLSQILERDGQAINVSSDRSKARMEARRQMEKDEQAARLREDLQTLGVTEAGKVKPASPQPESITDKARKVLRLAATDTARERFREQCQTFYDLLQASETRQEALDLIRLPPFYEDKVLAQLNRRFEECDEDTQEWIRSKFQSRNLNRVVYELFPQGTTYERQCLRPYVWLTIVHDRALEDHGTAPIADGIWLPRVEYFRETWLQMQRHWDCWHDAIDDALYVVQADLQEPDAKPNERGQPSGTGANGTIQTGGKPENLEGQCTHTPDFRSVTWFGTQHSFTPYQAACVKVWWQYWKTPTPDIGDETALQAAKCESNRVSDLFKRHRAWGVMIVQGTTKGTHRLQAPSAKEPDQPRKRNRRRRATKK